MNRWDVVLEVLRSRRLWRRFVAVLIVLATTSVLVFAGDTVTQLITVVVQR
ncbi:hypothetical protein L3Q67_01185 [Saccharothrix sp. AJ9571]|nr:hypothetical protein L3Q67_01185 [Saccharothrix sp. AJ9571]